MKLKANKREKQFQKEMLEQGFEVFSRGWPDFLVYDRENNKAKFVEIKRKQKRPSEKMGLSQHQRNVLEILKNIGLGVEIRYIE